MKRVIFLIILVLPSFLLGQSIPQAFNYQTVVRNSDGEVLKNFDANFDIQLYQVDSLIYSEEHFTNTSDLGIVNFKIGQGLNPSSDFSTIDWGQGPFNIRMKLNGEVMGKTDILPVPFALFSENSKHSSDWVNIGDSILFTQGKKIGIGTDSPDHTFDINGHIKTSLGLIMAPHSTALNNTDLKIKGAYRNVGGPEDYFRLFHGGENVNDNVPENRKNLWIYGNHNRFMDLSVDGKVSVGRLLYGSDMDHTLFVNGTAKVNGQATVKVLEITGGGDGAEYFNAEKLIEPGTLVSIAIDKEETIKISDKPYSKKVVGIVSGAGGINPGITLKQNEILDGNNLVSLWGRVYVKATTTNGTIKPGDLLTSSSISGHVMKAKNKRKRREAVVGMALSSLEEGEGLVKILIHRQ